MSSLRCYRNAVRIDAQHYNAWYGIGQIYYKQEKYVKCTTTQTHVTRSHTHTHERTHARAHAHSPSALPPFFLHSPGRRYEMTEYHYRRALEINRNSSVLRCCLGKTLHKMGCTDEALELLDEAVSKDPHNAIAKYA